MATQMLSGIAMGNATISVDFAPSPVILAKQFDTLGANVKSFREPLRRAVKTVMIPSIRKNFDEGGRPPWTPLVEQAQRNKALAGYGDKPILQRTGKLKRTATTQKIWTIDGPRGLASINAMPQSTWYGALHQGGYGADAFEQGSIVARPWAVMHPEDAADIEEVFFDWIEERVNLDLAGV